MSTLPWLLRPETDHMGDIALTRHGHWSYDHWHMKTRQLGVLILGLTASVSTGNDPRHHWGSGDISSMHWSCNGLCAMHTLCQPEASLGNLYTVQPLNSHVLAFQSCQMLRFSVCTCSSSGRVRGPLFERSLFNYKHFQKPSQTSLVDCVSLNPPFQNPEHEPDVIWILGGIWLYPIFMQVCLMEKFW